jgi:hypothetical protein
MNAITRPIPGLHDAAVTKLERYKLAWDNLLHIPDATIEQRCAAYIWLGYRVVEGEVKPEDWHKWHTMATPEKIEDNASRSRWSTSLFCIEVYTDILAGKEAVALQKIDANRETMWNDVVLYANNITSCLRMQAIAAYALYLKGDDAALLALAQDTHSRWRGMCQNLDPLNEHNHYRFAEMAYDCAPLHAMQCMIVSIKEEWSNRILVSEKDFPWWQCIKKMEIGNPRAIWSAPLKTRNDLARMLFKGVGAELGVAAGRFSKEILKGPGVSLLYSIDKWNDHHGVAEYRNVIGDLAAFGNRSIVLRATFNEALDIFPDEYLRWIYIDGYAHTGQDNGKTLDDWYPKLSAGGIFAGHDYAPEYPQTIEAVDKFVLKHGLTLYLTTDDDLPSWWVVKPK